VTYGLGVGATTIVGAGEAGATERAEGHLGQRVPGAKGTQGLLQVMRLYKTRRRGAAHSRKLARAITKHGALRGALPLSSLRGHRGALA